MKYLLAMVLMVLMGACSEALQLPFKVSGKYQYADGTCMLHIKDKQGKLYTIARSLENCSYEVGQEIK